MKSVTPYNLAGINACAKPCDVISLQSMLTVKQMGWLVLLQKNALTASHEMLHKILLLSESGRFGYVINLRCQI